MKNRIVNGETPLHPSHSGSQNASIRITLPGKKDWDKVRFMKITLMRTNI